MINAEYFFTALNHAMFKQGLNDTQLAEKAEYKKQYVSMIKNGKRGLTDENMTRLARALGYSLIDFVNLGKRLEAAAEGFSSGGEPVTTPQAQPEPKYATDIIGILNKLVSVTEKSVAGAQESITAAIRESKIDDYEKKLEYLRQELRNKDKRIADLEDDQIRLQTRVEGKLLRLVPDENGNGCDGGEKVA